MTVNGGNPDCDRCTALVTACGEFTAATIANPDGTLTVPREALRRFLEVWGDRKVLTEHGLVPR